MRLSNAWSITRWALLYLSLIVCRAEAGSVSFVANPNGGGNDGLLDLAGSVTTDIRLDSMGTTILYQQLHLVLTQGSILNHPFGGNTPPNGLLFASFPSLAYDSFVASGGPTSADGIPSFDFSSLPVIIPEPETPVFTPTEWNVAWAPQAGQDTSNRSDYLSARLTLSGDAVGVLQYLAVFGDGAEEFTDIPVPIVCGGQGPGFCDLPPEVNDFTYRTKHYNEVIDFSMTADNGPVTWGELENPVYTPVSQFPPLPGAFFNPEWNSETGEFHWNTIASTWGIYTWEVTATNDFGSDTGLITIIVKVPEPTSAVLLGLIVFGFNGVFRFRGQADRIIC